MGDEKGMMKKRNKKDQKLCVSLRNTWQRSPWTKIKENEKTYKRNSEKEKLRSTLMSKDSEVFLFTFTRFC